MLKKFRFIVLALTILTVFVLLSGMFSNAYAETISGRLVSSFDSQTGNAIILFAGYCKDEPVVIGPSYNAITAHSFANYTKENIVEMSLGKDVVIKRVITFNNNGKEIVAEVLMEK